MNMRYFYREIGTKIRHDSLAFIHMNQGNNYQKGYFTMKVDNKELLLKWISAGVALLALFILLIIYMTLTINNTML